MLIIENLNEILSIASSIVRLCWSLNPPLVQLIHFEFIQFEKSYKFKKNIRSFPYKILWKKLLSRNHIIRTFSGWSNNMSSILHYVQYTPAISNFALSRTFFPVPSAFFFPKKCLAISNYSLSRTNILVPRKNYSRYLEHFRKCMS